MDDLQGVGKDGFARLRARECQKSEGEDGFGAFAPNGSKLMSCRHPAGGKQGSTGALYLIVRILTSTQNKTADTERYQLFCGGGGRIRTIEAIRSRFTGCSKVAICNGYSVFDNSFDNPSLKEQTERIFCFARRSV